MSDSSMHHGVVIFPTDTAIQPVELGVACEERGFESLWFPEHSHIPTSRRTPWGGRQDAPPLPEEYWRTHDQFVALAAVAAATSSLRLGTGITLVAQRDPIWLAKQVASLDVISNGRVLFGVGFGWNVEEAEHHGVEWKKRHRIVDEKLQAMKRIWSEDEAEFHGEFVDFDPIWSWPKPVQNPHPPIVFGTGTGPLGTAAVVAHADGWMPLRLGQGYAESIGKMRQAFESAGRDPAELEISIFYARPDPESLDELEELGVARAVFSLPPAPATEVIPKLDELTLLR